MATGRTDELLREVIRLLEEIRKLLAKDKPK